MVKVKIATGVTTQQSFDIHNFHKVTVYNRSGTTNTIIELSGDGTNYVQKASVAADTITEITEDAIYIKVTPGTSATIDIVGEVL